MVWLQGSWIDVIIFEHLTSDGIKKQALNSLNCEIRLNHEEIIISSFLFLTALIPRKTIVIHLEKKAGKQFFHAICSSFFLPLIAK